MLLNKFFLLESSNAQNDVIEATVRLQIDHPIFEGHFPAQPIVPGVCMLQIIKEITEASEQQKFIIQTAASMKFLAVIDPTVNEVLQVSIKIDQRIENTINITASLFAGEVTFFKLKAALKLYEHPA